MRTLPPFCEKRKGWVWAKPQKLKFVPANFGAPMRFPFLFTVAGFALAGCTVDQMLSQPLMPQTSPRVVCSDANPIQYAQTCGFYVGRGKARSH